MRCKLLNGRPGLRMAVLLQVQSPVAPPFLRPIGCTPFLCVTQ